MTKFRKFKCLENVAVTFLKNGATGEEVGTAGVEMFQKR